ncbi:MAG: daunorubicin/doxorubicin resistance ABC transporter ATP-binding protein DrrA, partial [Cyanobacteria bacterium J06635_11]
GRFCEFRLERVADLESVKLVLEEMGFDYAQPTGEEQEKAGKTLAVPALKGARTLTEIVLKLEREGIVLEDVSLRRPSLDDVFFALTGHTT